MKLVLAEKPSVAMSLSKVIGANQRGDGYMEGNGYIVSWCVGHLVELSQPEAYDEKYAKWRYDDLPILPEHWQYQVSTSTKKQFGILKKLMQRKDLNLLQQAIAMDVPMLAVCRGAQGLNVALGGGLIQDIGTYLGQKVQNGEEDASRVSVVMDDSSCETPHYRVVLDGVDHRGATDYNYHTIAGGVDNENVAIDKTKSKWMYQILGTDSLNFVATWHHQAANSERIGKGLTVVARSSDGIVEAIEYQDNLFALGLQFHPEHDALSSTCVDSYGNVIDQNKDQCNALLGALVHYAGIQKTRTGVLSFLK